MNEQLIVKNFGPIKDATVDFKKVTVFIGPTGGGKSTLAKLAAVFRDVGFYSAQEGTEFAFFQNYSINNYFSKETNLVWDNKGDSVLVRQNTVAINESLKNKIESINHESNENTYKEFYKHFQALTNINEWSSKKEKDRTKIFQDALNEFYTNKLFKPIYESGISPSKPIYIPSERAFVASLEYSWAGLMRDDIGLTKTLLDFANSFSNSRKDVSELEIPMFNVKYQHLNGRDFIKVIERDEPLMLLETASGIQSVTPLLVLLEHLSRQEEKTQSFIIEEPELNLYPTAQQGLLNWLIEKCTTDENDLTITTHSPYILSHLNLLLYAYQVAEKHPDRADDVAKVVPRESWINPKEFAAYHVEGQKENGVHSIVNPETGLVSYNDLDALAGNSATEFDQLLDINAGLEVE